MTGALPIDDEMRERVHTVIREKCGLPEDCTIIGVQVETSPGAPDLVTVAILKMFDTNEMAKAVSDAMTGGTDA